MRHDSIPTCSAKQFGLFRICLGLYLTIHLALTAVHYDDFLWPSKMAPPDTAAPFWLFPLGILMSLIFTLGFFRKSLALGIWLILRFLVFKNIFYYGMNLDYVGFLLLLSVFAPDGEGLSLGRKNPDWKLPKEIYYGAWLVFTLSMTMSGVNKLLISPEWRSGDAIKILFVDSAAYYSEILKSVIMQFPFVFKIITWLILFLEIVSIIAFTNRHLRYYYSILTFIFFGSIAFFAVMSEIGMSVLIFEILLFDSTYGKNKLNEKT